MNINPSEINKTVREDIFNKGYFSAFDVLLWACGKKNIKLQYHFDEDLKTNVIDDLNGSRDWWYSVKYDGGGFEEPAHRMDTHPYKNKMAIRFYRVSPERTKELCDVFREEVERLNLNSGRVILEEVTLRSPGQRLNFLDVEVKPHRIRGEMFKPDVLTAADVVYSLAENGKLTFDNAWVNDIDNNSVKGYFFTRFNSEEGKGKAGFLHTLALGNTLKHGKKGFGDYTFNITPDTRVLVSPKSLEWKWVNFGKSGDEFEIFTASGKPKPRKSRKDSGEESYE